MSVGGKKLQTVYDSGVESLTGIETSTVENLGKLKKDHESKRSISSEGDAGSIETNAETIGESVAKQGKEANDAISQVSQLELEKFNDHKEVLEQELNRIAESALENIGQLKAGLADKVVDLQHELAGEIEAFVEKCLTELQQHEYEGKKEIRSRGGQIATRVQKKIDQNLWDWKSTKKNYSSQVEKSYFDKANIIESHFAAMIKALQNALGDHSRELEAAATAARESASSELTESLARAESIGSEMERSINLFFGEKLSSHEGELKEELDITVLDIQSTSEAVVAELRDKSDELAKELQDSAEKARETLRSLCEHTQLRAEELKDDTLNRLETRVQASRHARSELETTKSDAIQQIYEEIASLKDSFEKSLMTLTATAEKNVETIGRDVEEEIRGVYESNSESLEREGDRFKLWSQKEVEKILEAIEQHKQAALSEIALSAGAGQSH